MNLKNSLEEYLKVVKLGIQNGDKIIEGIITAAKVKNGEVSEEGVAEILRRKEICKNCNFNSTIASDTRHYKSSLPYEHCTLCLCRIGGDNTKEYCLSCKCGKDVWNNSNPTKPQMILEWDSFEPTTKN